jgi:hypothetical protein
VKITKKAERGVTKFVIAEIGGILIFEAQYVIITKKT